MTQRFSWAVIPTVLVMITLSNLPGSAQAEVNVNINIGPPPVVVAEPAEVVLIPQIGVYFVPDSEPDLFFYAGFWWSPRGGGWYRSRAYNGPWVVVERRVVPAQVIRVPKNYRVRYVKEKHVPYGQWKKSHHHRQDDHRDSGRHDHGKHKKNGKRDNGHGHR